MDFLLAQTDMTAPTLSGASLGLLVAILKVVIAFAVGIGAITLGFRILDRFTKGIDEVAELKRGNLAVGILFAAVILAYTNVIGSGLDQVTEGVLAGTLLQRLFNLIGGLVNLGVAVTVASLTVRYALFAFGKIMKEVDPMSELKKANLAIAFLLAGIIFGLSQVTSRGVNEIGAGIGSLLNALVG